LLFGFALSATVSNIRLGFVDESRPGEPRIDCKIDGKQSFQSAGAYLSVDQLGSAIDRGDFDAGVVIRTTTPEIYTAGIDHVQFLLNASNANTAVIAQGYAEGVIQSYNQGLSGQGIHARFSQIAAPDVSRRGVCHCSVYLLIPAWWHHGSSYPAFSGCC